MDRNVHISFYKFSKRGNHQSENPCVKYRIGDKTSDSVWQHLVDICTLAIDTFSYFDVDYLLVILVKYALVKWNV